MFSQGDIPLTEVAQCAAPERHRNCVCQSMLIESTCAGKTHPEKAMEPTQNGLWNPSNGTESFGS
jgi:hypothetical protein